MVARGVEHNPERIDTGVFRAAEIGELRLVLRYAAMRLTETERLAVSTIATGMSQAEAARIIGITRGGIHMATKTGIKKMRKRLLALGVKSREDLYRG